MPKVNLNLKINGASIAVETGVSRREHTATEIIVFPAPIIVEQAAQPLVRNAIHIPFASLSKTELQTIADHDEFIATLANRCAEQVVVEVDPILAMRARV